MLGQKDALYGTLLKIRIFVMLQAKVDFCLIKAYFQSHVVIHIKLTQPIIMVCLWWGGLSIHDLLHQYFFARDLPL